MDSPKTDRTPRSPGTAKRNKSPAITDKNCRDPLADFMLSGFVLHEIIYDETGAPWDYRILDVNPAFEKLTGFTDKEVIGKTLRELMPIDDHHWIETYSSIARTGAPVTFERYAAGLNKHLEITAMVSQKNRFAVMFSEIRKNTAGSGQHTFPRLSTLMDNLPGLAYQCLPESPWTMSYASQGAAVLTGYQPEELISGRIAYIDLVHPDDRKQVREAVQKAVLENRCYQMEYRIHTASGEEKWVREQGIWGGIRQTPSDVLEGLIIDITEQKRTEAALAETSERISMALDGTDEGIWDWDVPSGTIDYDPNWSRVLGYNPGKARFDMQWWKDHVSPETIDEFESALGDYLAGRTKYYELEYRIQDRTGQWRWIRTRGKCVAFDKDKRPLRFIGTNQDITDRKNLEIQFIQAQKMEAIGRLSGGVAHDFNNYLMTIIGYSEILQEELGDNDEMLELLEEIIKAGKNATGLIRQLLAFSRNQIFELEVMDLNEEIASMEKMLRRIIGEDIQITTFPAPELKTVRADKIQMQQVVMNLAVNARDAMPRGGKLTIETANVFLDNTYGRTHSVKLTPGPYVMLAVSDTGVGMDSETRQKIFEPFFTTKEKEEGTGLGLATIYGIIKQSNGYIWVYSEPEKGSTLKIYLPACGTEKDRSEKTDSPQAVSSNLPESQTILLVEDEVKVRTLLVRILQGYGYKVLKAPDGQTAEALCRSHRDPIDLMITDVVMPGMNGKEVADRIKQLRSEIKILFMSGYSDSAVVNHGILQDDVNFIQKPISPKVLAERVEKILARDSVPRVSRWPQSNGR